MVIIPDDIQKFNEIFKQRVRFILFAKSYIKDEGYAEDIVMEALMLYWEKRTEIRGNNTHAYILSIIKNKAINFLEHQKTVMASKEKISSKHFRELNFRISTLKVCNPEELFSNEIAEILNKTLQILPEHSRRIFSLSRFESKSNKEIASQLNLSVKTVEFHITKALKALRISLKDYLSMIIFLF